MGNRPSKEAGVAAIEPIGRRARKALAVRQALFEAGLRAFERQPIGLVSILDITEGADVAKGVFYLQFKSKDDYLLALWQELQQRFLVQLSEGVARCTTKAARGAAAVGQFRSFTDQSPAAARFWIRMSSYFPDEVGAPGSLVKILNEYHRSLACLIAGKPAGKLTAKDKNGAIVLDRICWAIVNAQFHQHESFLDEKKVTAAVRALLAN